MSICLSMAVTLRDPFEEPNNSLLEYVGQIQAYDESTDAMQTVGSARAYVADLDHCEERGFGIMECLDSIGATAPYLQLVSSQEAGSFSPTMRRVLEEPDTFSMNMLIIDRLEILPPHRGRGYGLEAMRIIIAQLGQGCRIAAIKPYPLQFEPKETWRANLELHRFTNKKGEATKRLKALYSGLGFKSVGRTDLMILSLE